MKSTQKTHNEIHKILRLYFSKLTYHCSKKIFNLKVKNQIYSILMDKQLYKTASYKSSHFVLFLKHFGQSCWSYLSQIQCHDLTNGLAVKALDFQSWGPAFKTTVWLQGLLSLSSLRCR